MARKERPSKKSRKRRVYPKQQQQSIEDVIASADSAMEAMDVSRALNLYSSAAMKLRNRLDVNESLLLQGEDDEFGNVRETLSAVLGKLGEAKVSQGDQEGARQDFADAIALLTEQQQQQQQVGGDGQIETKSAISLIQQQELRGGFYLYLGQLSSDNDALDAYKKGIADFETCLREREALLSTATTPEPNKDDDMVDDDDDDGEKNEVLVLETRRQLCGAYCAVAELYLTDLCFEDNAESQCEFYVKEALKLADDADGQPLVDALQAAASLRLSQQRGDEAAQHILQAYRKIEKGCKALAELVGLGASNDDNKEAESAIELLEVDAANNLPGFEFRCQTAKILMESASALKQGTVEESENGERASLCVESAIQVLGSLLAENDEVIEIWYLTGCAFAAMDPPNTELAGFYWNRAMEMLNEVKEQLEAEALQSEGDAEETDRIQCETQEVCRQINEITMKLQQCDDDGEDVWPMEDEEEE